MLERKLSKYCQCRGGPNPKIKVEEEQRKKREARQAAEAAEYNKNRPKTDSEIAEEIRKDREAFIKEQTERDRKLRE